MVWDCSRERPLGEIQVDVRHSSMITAGLGMFANQESGCDAWSLMDSLEWNGSYFVHAPP